MNQSNDFTYFISQKNDKINSIDNNDNENKNNTENIFYYYYECARCLYKTNYISSMKKHISAKKKCINNNNISLTDETLNDMSLIKKINTNYSFKDIKNDLSNENNINNISLSKKEESSENNISDQNNKKKNIENNENKKCNFCDKTFFSKQNLLKHNDICRKNPKYLENIKNQKEKELNNLVKNHSNNNSTNVINNNIINQNIVIENQQNNLIINLSNESEKKEIDKILIPFVDRFDTSHINDEIRMNLLFSHLYYDTLKEILKNKVNLNFLLDTSSNTSLVYKNDTENIVKIDNIIIYNNVWKKVRDYLLESLENIKIKYPKFDSDAYNHFENQIKKKYNEFIKNNNKDYTKCVIGTIHTLFEENRNEAENRFQLLNKMIENKN